MAGHDCKSSSAPLQQVIWCFHLHTPSIYMCQGFQELLWSVSNVSHFKRCRYCNQYSIDLPYQLANLKLCSESHQLDWGIGSLAFWVVWTSVCTLVCQLWHQIWQLGGTCFEFGNWVCFAVCVLFDLLNNSEGIVCATGSPSSKLSKRTIQNVRWVVYWSPLHLSISAPTSSTTRLDCNLSSFRIASRAISEWR